MFQSLTRGRPCQRWYGKGWSGQCSSCLRIYRPSLHPDLCLYQWWLGRRGISRSRASTCWDMLDALKSREPDGLHSRLLRDTADMLVRQVSITCEKHLSHTLQLTEKRLTFLRGKKQCLHPVSTISVSGKMLRVCLFSWVKAKKAIRKMWLRFTKGRFHLINQQHLRWKVWSCS